MVRDAYSAGGQSQQADGGAAAQPLDLHSNTASLTQELSQLLAASIAQGQASKRAASPVAAGAELANLQALRDVVMEHRTVMEAALVDRSGMPTAPGGLITPIKEILAALAERER